MDSSLRAQVARLFRPRLPGHQRTTRLGVEQELLANDLISGSSVAPERVRPAVAGRHPAAHLSFEPGGQVELSLPPAPSAAAASADLVSAVAGLARALQARGVVLAAQPVRPGNPATPRYLHTERYDAMERHFDAIGPAGRRMMRSTASTQPCLDWWPGRAGWEQWRLLQLAGPFLAAATARSVGPGGRLATWLAVDPRRTAFDARLLHGTDPVAAYAAFAAGAERIGRLDGTDHLTTLFPPVRPRGRYLEVRFPDAQPVHRVGHLLHGLAALLYDDERRRRALGSLRGVEGQLETHWAAAADGSGDVERGRALLGWTAPTDLPTDVPTDLSTDLSRAA